MFSIDRLGIYAIIAVVFLIIVGAGAWKYNSLVAENAVLNQKISQLQQNIADKEKEINMLRAFDELKENALRENREEIERTREELDKLSRGMDEVDGGDQEAVEYLKEFFRRYNGLKKYE